MLDIVDLVDILLALVSSWRVLLSCALATALILLIYWNISAPWDLVLSIIVGVFALTLGFIWERRC